MLGTALVSDYCKPPIDGPTLKSYLKRLFRTPSTAGFTATVVQDLLSPSTSTGAGVRGAQPAALDIGCGVRSPLAAYRDTLFTVGVDASSAVLEQARQSKTHHRYVCTDITEVSPGVLIAETGRDVFELVTLYDVIEHLPKTAGYELLDGLESLASRYIIVETPNGFRAQGPEYGNEYQRHLSGWFIHEFAGRGYTVYGNGGTRYIRDYAGAPRVHFPGWNDVDFVLATVLRIRRNPRHAYSLVAIKDLRGVAARLA